MIEVLSEEQQKFDTDLAGLPPALTRLLNRYLTFDAVREARLEIWVNPVKKSRLTEEDKKSPRLKFEDKSIPLCPRPAIAESNPVCKVNQQRN